MGASEQAWQAIMFSVICFGMKIRRSPARTSRMQTHPRQVLSFSPKQTAINTVFSAIGIQDCKVRKKKPTVDGLSHIKVMLLPGSCSNREIAQAAKLVSHKAHNRF